MRRFEGPVAWLVGIYAMVNAAIAIYTAGFGVWETRQVRALHLLVLVPLVFLLFPATRRSPTRSVPWYDWVLAALTTVCSGYVYLNANDLAQRWEGVSPVPPVAVVLGTIMVLLVLEGTRRAVSGWFTATAVLFLAYLVLSPYLPGFLGYKAYPYPRLAEMMFLHSDEGAFGFLVGISATLLMIFILFATFMLHSGVGQFFMDLSVTLAGRYRGGPAKVAVVSSALYGSVSGSSVADVYATGSFTIPLMKKIGYRKEMAAAIEATASSGGPLMPPVMGAGAFIMAEITGIPYLKIIKAAAIPAVLFFLGILATVHWEAVRYNIRGMGADLIPQWRAILRRSVLFTPFVLVVWALIAGYSPAKAALFSMLSAVAVSWLNRETRMTPARIFDACLHAARAGATIAVALSASDIIVTTMTRTGIALSFSSLILGAAGGSLLLALVLIMLVVSVLGTGLPPTPSYIIAASVGVGALTKLGIDPLATHMFVYYFAILADISPPVAVTAMAAAQIAEADGWLTQWVAPLVSFAGYLAPFLFVYKPTLLAQGPWTAIVLDSVIAIVGTTALAGTVVGHLYTPLSWLQRLVLAAMAVSMVLLPTPAGLAMAALVVGWIWYTHRTAVRSGAPDAPAAS